MILTKNKHDIRTYGELAEVRSLEVNGDEVSTMPVIRGYALKFDTMSHNLGFFGTKVYETLDKRCLDGADMSDVVALINHDSNLPLGRSNVNLELKVDDIGLYFEVCPTDTSYARDLVVNMRSGLIAKCSFAFTTEEKGVEYSKRSDGSYIRTVKKIKAIHDVSVVTNPAYEDTESTVSLRSFEAFKAEEQENNQHDVEIRKREIEIMMMRMQQAGV